MHPFDSGTTATRVARLPLNDSRIFLIDGVQEFGGKFRLRMSNEMFSSWRARPTSGQNSLLSSSPSRTFAEPAKPSS